MTKEEYAQLHYLIGKLKYIMFTDLKRYTQSRIKK